MRLVYFLTSILFLSANMDFRNPNVNELFAAGLMMRKKISDSYFGLYLEAQSNSFVKWVVQTPLIQEPYRGF